MTIPGGLRFDVAKPKPTSTKLAPAYSRYLQSLIEKHGIQRSELEKPSGLGQQTVWRIFTGQPEASVGGAIKIRRALIERGIDVEPVPADVENWRPKGAERSTSRLEGPAEIFRRNLVMFREQAGYPDLHEGARATGIPFEVLRAYELGDQEVSARHLLELARVYERNATDFELADPPAGKRPTPAIYFRVVGSLDEMSPENRQRMAELERQATELNEDERRRHKDRPASQKPKRR